MPKSVLIVDDERQILRSFSRLFMDAPYVVHTAESGREALVILSETPIDMVISDMRMPDMDGYALLREVKRLHPETIRLILSGYADERVIFNALQNNLAKLYLFKPWNNGELLSTITRVFQAEDELKDMEIFETVNGLEDLPTLLTTYNRLVALIEQDAAMDALASVIEEDPAITMRVLRIANSAFYGTNTGSVRQAITFLGLINVRNIVLTSSIYESAPDTPIVQKQLRILWRQSTLTSRIMLLLYQKVLNRKPTGDILSAGLLHDIGKLVTLNRFPAKFMRLYENPDLTDIPWQDEKETELFGKTHTDIGAYLLHWWGLPYSLIEAARYHHLPEDPRVINQELVSIIHLADCFAWELSGMPPKHGLSPFALKLLKLDPEELRSYVTDETENLLHNLS